MTSLAESQLPVYPDAFRGRIVSAEILAVGTELTQGLIVNSNSAWLCTKLMDLGVTVHAYATVADLMDLATEELLRSCGRSDLVIVTGGLGPTRDDFTRDIIAKAAGVGLVLDEPSLKHITEMFAKRINRPMTDNNRQQAMIPEGGLALYNPIGTAPGIACMVGKARVLAFPGVPRELFAMFGHVENLLAQVERPPGCIAVRKYQCFGTGESDIDRRIRHMMDPQENPFVAVTVADAVITVRLTGCAPTEAEAEKLLEPRDRELRQILAEFIFEIGDGGLPEVTARTLIENKLTVALAESCTGGMVASALTDTPGISAALVEGVVTYANEAKTRRLGVPESLLKQHGAVSHEVAVAMAEAVRAQAHADIGLGITGIAGPTGGTAEKPVGTVYIAVASRVGTEVRKFTFHGDRGMVRRRSTYWALNMIRIEASKINANNARKQRE